MNIAKFSVEFLLLLALGGFSTFITMSGRVKPWYQVYVSCDDDRYKHPLLPIEQHLVPIAWLYVAVLIVLPAVFFAIDMVLLGGFPKPKRLRSGDKVRKAFGECCHALALYYCGIFFLMIFCKVPQVIGGSPAPYFLALCAPGCSNVTGAYSDETTDRMYITQESCPEEELRQDSLSSFPCVHAVISFYASSFITVFYCSRGTTSYTRLLQPSIAVLANGLAFVTSLSRFREYSNHTVDVIGGTILGVAFACLQVLVVGRKLPDSKKSE